jgi:hypothetical protein
MSNKCGCDGKWICPEHRPGANIPIKDGRRNKKITMSPYVKGWLEAACVFGIIFLILRILEVS